MAMMSLESLEKVKRMPRRTSWGLGSATICLEVHLAFWVLAMLAAYWDQTHNTDFIKEDLFGLFIIVSLFSVPIFILVLLANAFMRSRNNYDHANYHTRLSFSAYGLSIVLSYMGYVFIILPYIYNIFANLPGCTFGMYN